jgi:hypothetical protein
MLQPITRAQVLRFRVHSQQLDRLPDPGRAVTAADVLDLGVQDTGTGGAAWSLVNRGVPVPANPVELPGSLALVWSIRGAPHAYRRTDLVDVEAAVLPFSEADAGKRIFDANKPLKAAGIHATDALDEVARHMSGIASEPTPKGVMSSRLAAELPAPYLRWCRVCVATHPYELPFRLAALRAGLELVPGTSPPVLRHIPAWSGSRVRDREPAPRLDVVRAYLHHLGPATPAQVAAYLDAPAADVVARWPPDAHELSVDGATAWLLDDDAEALRSAGDAPATPDAGPVRLIGPFDLFLQARDRERLVPDGNRRADLWRRLGRPGAVLAGGEIVGTWRPRASGRRLRVELDPWFPWHPDLRDAVGRERERLAAHRGLDLHD